MILTILNVDRIIAHDVVRRNNADPNIIPPVISNELFDCSAPDMQGLIIDRLTATLGKSSKCVDVEVQTPDTFHKIASLLDMTDDIYIRKTQELAEHLSNAQTGGTVKSGSALFLQGTCNYAGAVVRFISIIKADPDKALCKRVINGSITMELIKELFLSNAQRMIKVAFLIETTHRSDVGIQGAEPRDAEDFIIKVYDHLMSNSADHLAALYFFQGFLGCKIADNAAIVSRNFLNVSERFIMNNADISQEDRETYRGNLIAYMRGEINNIVPQEVADAIFPARLRDAYVRECNSNEVGNAFIKDNSLIKSRLAKRTIKFDSNIILYVPASVPQEQVVITNRDEAGWTTIKVLGRITS